VELLLVLLLLLVMMMRGHDGANTSHGHAWDRHSRRHRWVRKGLDWELVLLVLVLMVKVMMMLARSSRRVLDFWVRRRPALSSRAWIVRRSRRKTDSLLRIEITVLGDLGVLFLQHGAHDSDLILLLVAFLFVRETLRMDLLLVLSEFFLDTVVGALHFSHALLVGVAIMDQLAHNELDAATVAIHECHESSAEVAVTDALA
jgi:hypothetical protein